MSLIEQVKRKMRRRWRLMFAKSMPRHPLDVQYGIETAGSIPAKLLSVGDAELDRSNVGYAGSQPNIIRQAIGRIGDMSHMTFVDIGSGKGRALAVASEYRFQRIIGIELSSALCEIARQNAKIISARHPGRTEIEVVCGNATIIPETRSEAIAFYIYNSFGLDLIRIFLENLETFLSHNADRKVFIIYYKPVHFTAFDGSSRLERFSAECFVFTEDERSSSVFGNDHDSVVIYQSRTGPMLPPCEGADRPIRVTVENFGADVIIVADEPGNPLSRA